MLTGRLQKLPAMPPFAFLLLLAGRDIVVTVLGPAAHATYEWHQRRKRKLERDRQLKLRKQVWSTWESDFECWELNFFGFAARELLIDCKMFPFYSGTFLSHGLERGMLPFPGGIRVRRRRRWRRARPAKNGLDGQQSSVLRSGLMSFLNCCNIEILDRKIDSLQQLANRTPLLYSIWFLIALFVANPPQKLYSADIVLLLVFHAGRIWWIGWSYIVQNNKKPEVSCWML